MNLFPGQYTFFKKIQLLHQHQHTLIPLFHDWIDEWNNPLPTTSNSRWKHLTKLSLSIDKLVKDQFKSNKRYLEHAFRSLIRELLMTAFRPYYQDEWTANQLVEDILDAKQLVALPFMKLKKRY